MPLNRYFLCILLLILASAAAVAQQVMYKSIPPQFELEHLKLNNKSDLGFFNDITEDKEGYIWLSSTKGLHVFDGIRTITYAKRNKQFLLCPDSVDRPLYYFSKNETGALWIQDENEQLILFDPIGRKCLKALSKMTGEHDLLFYSASSPQGTIYVATVNRQKNTKALWEKRADDSFVKIYEAGVTLQIFFHYIISGNYHWLIEGNQLTRISLDGKNIANYKLPTTPTNGVYFYTTGGTIYFIDNRFDAVYFFNTSTSKVEEFIKIPQSLKGKISGFFIKDSSIYLGSNVNLFILDKVNKTIQDLSSEFKEITKKEAPNSFATQFMNFFLCKDSSLLLTTQADIYRIKKKTPGESQFKQAISVDRSYSGLLSFRQIAEDDKKNIYASYYTGIAKKTTASKNFIPIPVKQYINGDLFSTYSLNYWKNHLLWNNVDIQLANGKFKYIGSDKFGGHCTQCLHNDTLWLFQWGSDSLYCYDLINEKVTSLPIDNAVYNGIRNALQISDIKDDGKYLWISTSQFGISQISKTGKLIKRFSAAALGTGDNNINELELIGDKLWFGCNEGLGLLNTSNGKCVIYKNPVLIENEVLKNRVVFSILPDEKRNFYLGSNYGLLYFDTKTSLFYNLPKEHPLASIEFNKTSAFKTSDKRYYFGSTIGLYSFMADELTFNKVSNTLKPIKLFSVAVFNNDNNSYSYLSGDLDGRDKLVLQPFNSNIEFNFSIPEFYKKVFYSYRIKEQNEKWSDYSPENKIQLNSLQPGKYILEVKASTGLSDEDASYFNLPIEMKQVWYKKAWVIALLIVLLGSILIGLLRYRFNQKLNRQKELAALRTKISSDLHDDVGTILSGLAMQSQILAIGAKDETKEQLNEISGMSRDAMERMRDTVWAMDNRKDKLENLIDRMRDFAEKNFSLKKLTHQFDIDITDSKKFIDPEKRQQVYLIFKEAVTNIIKHSNGSHVQINFTESKNNLKLIIHDNGTVNPTGNSDGLGISNMKMRAEKIGGTLTAKYENGFVAELDV